jgi:translation elongation factor EF-1alpha
MTGNLMGDCVHAKIEAGIISEKQKFMIMPHDVPVTIKGIEINGVKKSAAKVGDICTLALNLKSGFESTWL